MLEKLAGQDIKRYYTIGEVAELFEVSRSLIRFWENEFDILRPHKNSKGDRRFTPQNLEQLQLIYELVKERGFTLDGARREIKRLRAYRREKAAVRQRLLDIRAGLEAMRDELES